MAYGGWRRSADRGGRTGVRTVAVPRHWRFDALDAWEMSAVRSQLELLRNPTLRISAVALNHLGNGWLYVSLAILLFAAQGWGAFRVAWPAVVSAALAHGIYPVVKSHIQRPRPIERDPTLARIVAPLDAFSCPSGHCMTAVAVFVPLALAFSHAILPLSVLTLLIGWARLAVAHHYPSDLLLGALLGGGIALPVSWYFLP